MKRRTVLGSLAVAVLALSSTVVAAQEKKPIRIGVITEMSGPFADYGR
tara:strand:- start:40388 stop:40531 length:144 start_codon:yes stop_codon:yes gene_type:complete